MYRTDIVLVMRDKKLDWVNRYQKHFERPEELRALVRGGAAVNSSKPVIVEEKRGPMLRQLAIAVRAQPDIVVRPLMWKRDGNRSPRASWHRRVEAPDRARGRAAGGRD